MGEDKEAGVRNTDLTIWAIFSFLAGVGGILVGLILVSGRYYDNFGINMINFFEDTFHLSMYFDWWPPTQMFFVGVGIIAIIGAAFFIIIGIGIWTMKPWARILAILMGFLMIPNGIGIVVLWYFMRSESKAQFGVD